MIRIVSVVVLPEDLVRGRLISFRSLDEELGKLFKAVPPSEDAYIYQHNATPLDC